MKIKAAYMVTLIELDVFWISFSIIQMEIEYYHFSCFGDFLKLKKSCKNILTIVQHDVNHVPMNTEAG